MAAPLEQRLVQARLVRPEMMAGALNEQVHTGRCLEDCLLGSRALTEEALLEFLAKESGAESLLGRRFARVLVSPWVLDRVPAQLADELSVLPLGFDDKTEKLTLAVVDPAATEVISRVIEVARPKGVRRVAVLESVIRAGIRKFYFAEADAFNADGQPKHHHYRCTNCRGWLQGAVVWCPGCYLLLDPSAPEASAETSVIRVLLGDPLTRQTVQTGADAATTASRPFVPLLAVVALASESRLEPSTLLPFEAFVSSRANGRRTVADIARSCGLAEVEAQAVVTALVGREVLAVIPPQAIALEELPEQDAGSPPNRAQWDLLEEAVRHERAGDFDAAIKVLTRGIEQMSNAPRLYNRLAAVLLRRSDHFGALQLLELAARLDPSSRVIRHNLVQLRELVGK